LAVNSGFYIPIVKKIFTIAFVISGLGLLAWPFMLFMSCFIWDAPIRSAWDELSRLAIMLWLLGYPAVWAASLGCGIMALHYSWKKIMITAMMVPYLYILSKVIVIIIGAIK
jgi:hypothetical protein